MIIKLKRMHRNSGIASLEDIRPPNGNFRLGLFHRVSKETLDATKLGL